MVIVVGVRVVVVHGCVTAVLSPPPHEVVAIIAVCVCLLTKSVHAGELGQAVGVWACG